jgi:CheY-like chemotaxis protein
LWHPARLTCSPAFVTFGLVSPAQNDEPALAAKAFSPLLRVLVVDDDSDTVATLLALLRSEGHEVQGASSGRAALAALRQLDPDVVISDIAMPNVNGWTLARQVRDVMGEKRPLMIAITGQYVKSLDKVLAHISGFDYYLTKPADPNVLMALVACAKAGR